MKAPSSILLPIALAPLQGATQSVFIDVVFPGHPGHRCAQPWARVFRPFGPPCIAPKGRSVVLGAPFAKAVGPLCIAPNGGGDSSPGMREPRRPMPWETNAHAVFVSSRPEGAREIHANPTSWPRPTSAAPATRLESELATVRAEMPQGFCGPGLESPPPSAAHLAQRANRTQPRAERSDALGALDSTVQPVFMASRPERAREVHANPTSWLRPNSAAPATRLESELATARAKMQAYLEELGV